MRWADIPFDASHRTLRQFAGLWVLFVGGLAWYWGYWREFTTVGWVLAVLALTIGPLGLVWPAAIRPIWIGLLTLTFPIGWVVSHILLGVVYYGMFTPLSLFFKLIGRDLLTRRRPPQAETYWVPKPAVTDPRRYYRQF
jgi:hypothetical protein